MNLWQGEWLSEDATAERLRALPQLAQAALLEPLATRDVLIAADALSVELRQKGPVWQRLQDQLVLSGTVPGEVEVTLHELAEFLKSEALNTKLVRELGTVMPERWMRRDFKNPIFEAWAPLGLLVHISPSNAATVAALSVVEGLLTGNVNLVKLSGDDSCFTMHVLSEMAAKEPSGSLARRCIALRFPSSRSQWLEAICAHADGIAVWGGEDALVGIQRYVPPGCRVVEWGPKISFAYLTRDVWNDSGILQALAQDICQLDQQACASPQIAYLDTDDFTELNAFAASLASVLEAVSHDAGRSRLSLQEQAEITNIVVVTQLEEHLGLSKVYGTASGRWRLLVDSRPSLRASPLYRTLWIKPLPRALLVETLRPMRRYLQTMGIAGSPADTAQLTKLAGAAGVLRVTRVGGMLGSYEGEPHDGIYALPRYARRLSAQLDDRFQAYTALDEFLRPTHPRGQEQRPVLTKTQFQIMQIADRDAELYFKSGGSSGDPKLSVFTYLDYHTQMRAAAEGLVAAGLDPACDRVMNLFFSGGLYGGFVSFFSILEILEATQFPMAAHPEHRMVAESIVRYRVDTLLGAPSYILQVFAAGADLLRAYRGIKKIFFGGEHFGSRQRQRLCDEFGVQIIRSASYGSVDAGPLGYQCVHASGGIHHVLTTSQQLEILAMDADRPVMDSEVGRLVFSSLNRRGQNLQRYEIGDLGRWVVGNCPCGRQSPRFELLGRFGDVFRIAACFLNYRKFATIAAECGGYAGEVQIVIEDGTAQDRLSLRLDRALLGEGMRETLLAEYDDLREVVVRDRLLEFVVEPVAAHEMDRTPGSGKLRTVIDRRRGGNKP